MRFWLQYHNYDKLGYLPGSYKTKAADLSTLDTSDYDPSCITTSKRAICDAIGDVAFFILGYGKDKKYLLWSWCVIEDVYEGDEGEYEGVGPGCVLNPPPLLTGREFDAFRKKNANFSLGFRDISNLPFLGRLCALAQEYGCFDLSESYADALHAIPQEVHRTDGLVEGALRVVTVNAYERNPEARRECIVAHKPRCVVCGFDFGLAYGPEFAGLIHVHHLRPLSEVGGEYVVDPVEDLRPVCPNCHAVIHHRGRLRSIDEVRQLLAQQRQAAPGTSCEAQGKGQ